MYLQTHFKYKETLNTKKKSIKKIIKNYKGFEKVLK